MMSIARKIAAVLLSLLIIAAACSPAMAYTDTQETPQREAINVVSALGVMKGYQDGTFKPEQLVTRAELAQVISVLCRIGVNDPNADWYAEFFSNEESELALKQPQTGEQGRFEDVPSDYWAYDIINNVVDFGLMNGVSAARFEPDSNITLQDAVKTMVLVLGYGIKAENKGGYPLGYVVVANELKLLRGLSSALDKNLTRGELAGLIYNAIDVELLQTVGYGQTKDYATKDGETLLTKMLKANKIKGRLTSNDTTSLTGPSKVGRNRVIIENREFLLNDKTQYVADLIGYEVEAYYTDDISADAVILYAAPTKNNLVLTISADKIKGFSSNRLEYFQKDSGELESADIVPGSPMIYNGVAKSVYNADTFVFNKGDVTLISTSGSKYDTIIINDYHSYVVGSVYADDYKVFNKSADNDINTPDSELVLDTTDNSMRIKIVSDDGKPLAFDQIKADNVLSVAKNGNCVKVIVSTKTVSKAVIEEISVNNCDTVIVADGKEYVVSKDYLRSVNKTNFEVGDMGTIYLDAFGQMAWFEKASKEDMEIAYLVKSAISNSGVKKVLELQLFCTDSKVKVLSTADKIIIDDKSGLSKLYEKEEAADILASSKGVIRYSLGEDGLVKAIELPLDKQNENAGSRLYKLFQTTTNPGDINYQNNFSYKTSVRTFGGKVYLDNSTVIISQPADPLDEKGYSITNTSSFQNDKSYEFTAYGTTPNSPLAKVVVAKSILATAINVTDLAVVVTKITNTVDKDGEKVVKVEGMQYNSKVELNSDYGYLDSTGKPCTAFDIATDVFKTTERYRVNVGDIIKYSVDSSTGFVNNVQVLYKADLANPASPNGVKGFIPGSSGIYDTAKLSGNPFATDDSGTLLPNAVKFTQGSMRMIYGFVYAMVDNYITVTTQDLSVNQYDKTNSDPKFVTEFYSLPSFKTTAVEFKGEKVTVKTGSAADIQTYKNAGTGCSRVIAIVRYGDPTQLIIINGHKD